MHVDVQKLPFLHMDHVRLNNCMATTFLCDSAANTAEIMFIYVSTTQDVWIPGNVWHGHSAIGMRVTHHTGGGQRLLR